MTQLYAMGNALVDLTYQVDDAFLQQQQLEKSTMKLADAAAQQELLDLLPAENLQLQASGGSAANTTFAFSAFGGDSFYACRVGSDEFAHFYLKDLAKANIVTSPQALSEGCSGSCVVMVTADSERTMQTFLGVSAELSAAQLDLKRLETAQWLYIEGYLASSDLARDAVLLARQQISDQNCKVAISLSDPAMVQYAKTGLDQMIGSGVDLLFCNQQEALMYTGCADLNAAIAELQLISAIVVVTLGASGVVISQKGQERIEVAAVTVEVLDANGAGDAFAGAFLWAHINDFSLQLAAELAVKVAAQVVSQYGPRLQIESYQLFAQQFLHNANRTSQQ